MEVKLGKRVVKDVIRGDLLEVEVDVAATNRSYGELLAPRRRVEQRAENERRADAAQRIEDAQRLLDSLD